LAACAGFPGKQKPVALPAAAPISGLDETAGGSWPEREWWHRYADPTLNMLIDQAVATAPTLATAHARFDAARETVREAGAASGARVDFVGDAERQRLSDNGIISFFPASLSPGFNWYNQFDLGLKASYTFDWWGKQRALVESAVDQAHAAQAERSAAALSLESAIADTYFGWQADQARLALARERLAVVQREGLIATQRVRAELDSAANLPKADGAIAAVQEQIAALEGSAQLRIVALAALVGRPAADLPPLTARALPTFPADLPDNVRLDLISRRADITASRWRVEAAERRLDSARAEFYPDLSINALAGLNSLTSSKLLEYGSRAPSAGVAIHLPIFDAGRLKAQYRGAEFLIDAAVSTYDQAIVDAARDVATQVATRAQIAAERSQRVIQLGAAEQFEKSEAARVRQRVADLRAELVAAEMTMQQRDALLQLDAAALSNDISLQRALGGGYQRPASLADANPVDAHSLTSQSKP
jgi:multidrug efflux system outer membrane protein